MQRRYGDAANPGFPSPTARPPAQLFDDVLIFNAGHEVYHGPVQDAVPFFASLGFDCPARKDIPSFLLEVTTAKGACVVCVCERLASPAPRTQGQRRRGGLGAGARWARCFLCGRKVPGALRDLFTVACAPWWRCACAWRVAGQHAYASRELRLKHNLPLDASDFHKARPPSFHAINLSRHVASRHGTPRSRSPQP